MRELVANLQTRIPVVHIDKFPAAADEYVVCSDHYGAGYLAARHFIERGKSRLAFYGSKYPPFVERLRGFKKAMAEANLQPDDPCVSLNGLEINHMSVFTRIVRAQADAAYARARVCSRSSACAFLVM